MSQVEKDFKTVMSAGKGSYEAIYGSEKLVFSAFCVCGSLIAGLLLILCAVI